MFKRRNSIILIFIFISFCTSPGTREDEKILISGSNASLYEKYLVSPDQYTTQGSEYHNKYLHYLLGIARLVIEDKKIEVFEKSIGLYYDKRENRKDKLYLGIDISAQIDSTLYYSNYYGIALAHLRKYLRDVLDVFRAAGKIFSEKEIVGSVITIKWERDNVLEMVSIWINKEDVDRYEKNQITFNELIQRNFITNTEGNIIKLLL